MKAALLPLDDRPYNLSFVQGLADLGGIELITPPDEAIGYFFSPGSPPALASWLLNLPEDVEAVIVAVDMLTCGGLLASRSEEITTAAALEGLSTLGRLREERPDLLVLAFDTIIRTSLSARDPVSRRVHRLLHRWTSLAARAEEAPDDAVRTELHEVSAAIPPAVLERYLRVRARKHAVNRAAIELVGDGVIDVLHLLMEDVGPGGDRYGVHKHEQNALRELARSLGVSERIALHNGTDEGASVLLALLANTRSEGSRTLRFLPIYSATDGASQIPTFEDRPFGENLASFVRAVGAELTDDPAAADAVLAVHSPYGAAPDLAGFTGKLVHYVSSGMPVALIDTTTNCADPELMERLRTRMRLDDLAAFSAWNTACNSLGTALAQLVIYLRSGVADARARNKRLTLERLLDDWVYESLVRPQLNERLEAEGLNPWDLHDQAGPTRALMAPMMQRVAAEVLAQAVATPFSFSATLPWPRTFEPRISVRLAPEAAEI